MPAVVEKASEIDSSDSSRKKDLFDEALLIPGDMSLVVVDVVPL